MTDPTTIYEAEEEYQWQTHAEAARLVCGWVDEITRHCEAIQALRQSLHRRTGTRLIDWLDHLVIPAADDAGPRLEAAGFAPTQEPPGTIWRHPEGVFPAIRTADTPPMRMAIKVASVADYLEAHHLPANLAEGSPLCSQRRARVASGSEAELWLIERHGDPGFAPSEPDDLQAARIRFHRGAFAGRLRDFDQDQDALMHTRTLIGAAVADVGAARASDLFFAAEREYWQHRNRAARVQRSRQDALGLGWGNHDHHTYRSSRAYFHRLIRLFERLGLVCRERFYAGREAGWGAQILEQPASGVVVFADVDLSPDEVTGDFAHEPLPPLETLGTVGLWCALHGESVLQAGMHHLECRFDFDAAPDQLAEAGVETMPPFTDLPHLKQSFTRGETWAVDPRRLGAAQRAGLITDEQAQRFERDGALGSHLEILQRDDGYKGFNPSGISDIIRATDPRRESRRGFD